MLKIQEIETERDLFGEPVKTSGLPGVDPHALMIADALQPDPIEPRNTMMAAMRDTRRAERARLIADFAERLGVDLAIASEIIRT